MFQLSRIFGPALAGIIIASLGAALMMSVRPALRRWEAITAQPVSVVLDPA